MPLYDEDEYLFSAADLISEDEEESPDLADDSEEALIAKLAAALKAKNIVVPDCKEMDLREFCEHLLSGLATSNAHENADGDDEAPPAQYAVMSRHTGSPQRGPLANDRWWKTISDKASTEAADAIMGVRRKK